MSKDPLEYLRHIADECTYLLHDYFGVNYLIVWDVFKNKIPELNRYVSELLKNNG